MVNFKNFLEIMGFIYFGISQLWSRSPRRFAYDDEAIALHATSPCESAWRVPSNRRGLPVR